MTELFRSRFDPAESAESLDPAAIPTAPSEQAETFYAASLRTLIDLGVPFLVSGTYALCAYTGLTRPTKDLDLCCKPGDFPRILAHLQALGHRVETEDERWIGKVWRNGVFFDVIFASAGGTMPVTDAWFADAPNSMILGVPVRLVAPTELLCAKAFIQLRHRFDGADVMHLILKQHDRIDWARLLLWMEQHWEVLLANLINFRWIYPSERDCVPSWLLHELLARLSNQMELPPSRMKLCRGGLLSHTDYQADVTCWGFADTGSRGEFRR